MTPAGTPAPQVGGTVSTAAELDALPIGSVVRDGLGGVFESFLSDVHWPGEDAPPAAWYKTGHEQAYPNQDGDRPAATERCPAMVLFRPDAPQPAPTGRWDAWAERVAETIPEEYQDGEAARDVIERGIARLVEGLGRQWDAGYAAGQHPATRPAPTDDAVERAARALLAAVEDSGVDANPEHDGDPWWQGYRQAQREYPHGIAVETRDLRAALAAAGSGAAGDADRLSQTHADALATLDYVSDRMDEFAYDELHSVLEDGVLLRDEDGSPKHQGRAGSVRIEVREDARRSTFVRIERGGTPIVSGYLAGPASAAGAEVDREALIDLWRSTRPHADWEVRAVEFGRTILAARAAAALSDDEPYHWCEYEHDECVLTEGRHGGRMPALSVTAEQVTTAALLLWEHQTGYRRDQAPAKALEDRRRQVRRDLGYHDVVRAICRHLDVPVSTETRWHEGHGASTSTFPGGPSSRSATPSSCTCSCPGSSTGSWRMRTGRHVREQGPDVVLGLYHGGSPTNRRPATEVAA